MGGLRTGANSYLNGELGIKQLSNIDVNALDTGRYYVTNSNNLPAGWVAAYLNVMRVDNNWCTITAYPPYDGDDCICTVKQVNGTWKDWQYNRCMLITATNQSDIKCYVNTKDDGLTQFCLSYKGAFFAAFTADAVDVTKLPPNPSSFD